MPEQTPVNIGGVMVGDAYPTVFVAEIGTFFNQDIELGRRFIKAAVDAGAPIVKSEVLHNPDVCLNTDLLYEYQHATGKHVENYRALIERKVVPLEHYRELYGYCKELGVPFIASVYDVEGIDFFAEIGGAAIKFARTNINNIPLIRYAASTGLPIIFDAGIVYLDEVALAVRTAQAAGAGGVIVNHHPGANPSPPDVHNMRVMQTYKETFGVPVGLSCHYRGDEMLYLAVGMGANLLEKGIVDNPDRVEQDIVSAAALDEIPAIIQKVNNCWQAIGQPIPQPKEPRNLTTRKALVASKPIAQGEPIDMDNVLFAWPPLGISVEHWDVVVGKPAARDLAANDVIRWGDVLIS